MDKLDDVKRISNLIKANELRNKQEHIFRDIQKVFIDHPSIKRYYLIEGNYLYSSKSDDVLYKNLIKDDISKDNYYNLSVYDNGFYYLNDDNFLKDVEDMGDFKISHKQFDVKYGLFNQHKVTKRAIVFERIDNNNE